MVVCTGNPSTGNEIGRSLGAPTTWLASLAKLMSSRSARDLVSKYKKSAEVDLWILHISACTCAPSQHKHTCKHMHQPANIKAIDPLTQTISVVGIDKGTKETGP